MKTGFSQRTSRLERVALAGGLATLLAIPGPATGAQAETMRQYQFDVVDGEVALVMKEVDRPVPGANEVLVRVRATSLNRRDLSILQSQYGGGNPRIGLVPLSDGAGEVIGLGPGVSRFEVGDRVAGIFFARWMDGRPSALTNASARGGAIDGMLSEMIVSHEDGLVEIPEHLTFEEAATLPCAGLTAWNALFKHGGLSEDDFVLLEGTGGVSIFGLQFSVAAGARPIITSSSDAKLVRARELGGVRHRQLPDQPRVGGRGAGHHRERGRHAGPRSGWPGNAAQGDAGTRIRRPHRYHRRPFGLRQRHAPRFVHRPCNFGDGDLCGIEGGLRSDERLHYRTSAAPSYRQVIHPRGGASGLRPHG